MLLLLMLMLLPLPVVFVVNVDDIVMIITQFWKVEICLLLFHYKFWIFVSELIVAGTKNVIIYF
jgi:hypothetical protein